jgi:hypothetical protein
MFLLECSLPCRYILAKLSLKDFLRILLEYCIFSYKFSFILVPLECRAQIHMNLEPTLWKAGTLIPYD